MSSSDMEEESWIEWFCSLEGNEFFVEVEPRFIEDNFNLYGLRSIVPSFREALDIILDRGDYPQSFEERMFRPAVDLFGLIHARYCLTTRGLDRISRKFEQGEFGFCPRVLCEKQAVLPIGISDTLRRAQVMLYCPMCTDIFHAPSYVSPYIDGAYFGTTLPHLLLMVHERLVPPPAVDRFEPRVFGFKVHKTARCRMLQDDYRKRMAQAEGEGGSGGGAGGGEAAAAERGPEDAETAEARSKKAAGSL